MTARTGPRRVHFAVPPQGAFAVQLRLTPALLEALLGSQDAGQAASIVFGQGAQPNAITVGGAAFRFTALAEESCDLLSLAPGGGGGQPTLVGAVRQKLMVQRNIADERGRVRARAEEAERRGHERKAQLLEGKPAGKPAARPRPATHRLTPPPAGGHAPRGPTPPPARQQLTASMLAAPAGRPPTHPGRAPTPPPPSAAATAAFTAAKPVYKSASAGKLGGRATAAGSSGSVQLAAPPLVLRAVRGGAPLRLVLIATLAERPMGMNAVKAVLSDAASRVRSFKAPAKDQLERALKAVAEFKAPGVYILYPLLLKELDELVPAGDSASPLAASPPTDAGAKRRRAPAGEAEAAGRGAPPPAKRTRKQQPSEWTDDDSSDAEPPAAHARGPRRAGRHGTTPPPPASGSPASAAAAGASSGSGGAARPRRSSSSRGSDLADESWIEEHADRQPQPAAPICSKEEYAERAAAFAAKYDAYFALHQLLEAHKKDFEALAAAAAAAASPGERERHRAELQRLHERRGERAKRWDAAYKVLHQELSAAKARMAEFVAQLRQPAPGGGGGEPAAAAVRVQ